jgi:hypothetical protein
MDFHDTCPSAGALALERENRTHTLFQLTRNLSKASGTNEVLMWLMLKLKHISE